MSTTARRSRGKRAASTDTGNTGNTADTGNTGATGATGAGGAGAAEGAGEAALDELALKLGDRVRYRRGVGRHWHEAKVVGRGVDGSVTIIDDRQAWRSLTPDRLEVAVGGLPTRWEPVLARAGRPRQLGLW